MVDTLQHLTKLATAIIDGLPDPRDLSKRA